MSLCINPNCSQPSHPGNDQGIICQSCGSGLLLQGRYRVMRLLSRKSGFGDVYEAYERGIPKILKILKRDRSTNPKVLALFQKEAEVLSQLQHAGVPYVEADGYFTYQPQDDDLPLHCIVMEKIDGPNLQQWMQQQGGHPIGEKQALQWLMQLTDILRRIHQHNYFHRDIKPDNVMLRANGQLVLVDFGAAREMTQTYLAQVGSLGVTTVSSAGYTPPEQEQGQAVPQSDFYALGRTMVYLLTGRSPNDTALYDPLRNTFNWRTQAPQVSEAFADLLDMLIAPRVIDRPKTAQEILERLSRLPQWQQILATDTVTILPETTLPDSDTLMSGAFSTDIKNHTAHQSTQTGFAVGTGTGITRWTWLIAGGVTAIAIALLGLGIWGRTRLLRSSPTLPSNTTDSAEPAKSVPTYRVELLRTFPAHQNSINALLALSDQRRFVSASADNTLRLWDLSTGETLQTYEGHTSFVNTIVLSPDEKMLYSGSADGRIYQWILATGEQQAEWLGHNGPINALAQTPDGQFLVSGGSDGTLKVWDLQDSSLVKTLTGHEGGINTLVVTSDGRRVISGGTDLFVRVWDIASATEVQSFVAHESFINQIAVSPDGRILFSASADETIKRWDLNEGNLLDTLTNHVSYVNVLQFNRNGRTVSSGSADETVHVWDVKTGALIKTYTGFEMSIDHLLVLSDGRLLTASKQNPAIKSWLVNDR